MADEIPKDIPKDVAVVETVHGEKVPVVKADTSPLAVIGEFFSTRTALPENPTPKDRFVSGGKWFTIAMLLAEFYEKVSPIATPYIMNIWHLIHPVAA